MSVGREGQTAEREGRWGERQGGGGGGGWGGGKEEGEGEESERRNREEVMQRRHWYSLACHQNRQGPLPFNKESMELVFTTHASIDPGSPPGQDQPS